MLNQHGNSHADRFLVKYVNILFSIDAPCCDLCIHLLKYYFINIKLNYHKICARFFLCDFFCFPFFFYAYILFLLKNHIYIHLKKFNLFDMFIHLEITNSRFHFVVLFFFFSLLLKTKVLVPARDQ